LTRTPAAGPGRVDYAALAGLRRYHWVALLALMAVASVSLAWNSYRLIALSMTNVDFLQRYGLLAVMEGGLVQPAVITVKGKTALLSHLLFEGIEVESMQRWRR